MLEGRIAQAMRVAIMSNELNPVVGRWYRHQPARQGTASDRRGHELTHMSRAIGLERTQLKADRATIDAIARETATPADIVSALYEEEIGRLTAQAKLTQFIAVIATKRVKQQLRKLSGHKPRSSCTRNSPIAV
jgi:hypothetical protein